MKSIWMVALLGLVLLVPLASAGDVASSEASGQLGVGVDNEDDQGEDFQSLTSESEEALGTSETVLAVIVGVLVALGLTLVLFFLFSLAAYVYYRRK